MKANYSTPQMVVVNIEIEDAILSVSSTGSVEDLTTGSTLGDF